MDTPVRPTGRLHIRQQFGILPSSISQYSVRSSVDLRESCGGTGKQQLSMVPFAAGKRLSNSSTRLNKIFSDKKHFQNRKEKSTGILVGIILVFVLCHVFRLSIQVRHK